MQHQQPGKHSVHENCNHKQVLGIWRGKLDIWGGKGFFDAGSENLLERIKGVCASLAKMPKQMMLAINWTNERVARTRN